MVAKRSCKKSCVKLEARMLAFSRINSNNKIKLINVAVALMAQEISMSK